MGGAAVLALAAIGGGCIADDGTRSVGTAELPPVLGQADGTDSADYECGVVLRTAGLVATDAGYVVEGTIDLASRAQPPGFSGVHVLYRGDDDAWYSVRAVQTGESTSSESHYAFRLTQHTPPADRPIEEVEIELVPFIRDSD